MPRLGTARAGQPAREADPQLALEIGGRLRDARLRAGLTQQQLAGDRYTKAYVSALENGTSRPSMAALTFFARRLSVAPAYLLGQEADTWTRLEADLRLAAGDWTSATDGYQALLDAEAGSGTRAEVLRGMAEALCRLDRSDEATTAAAESVELFRSLGREADAALSTYWLAFALHQRGNHAEARSLLRAVLDRVRGGLAVDPDFELRLLTALSLVESAAGEFRTAASYLEEARGLRADLDDRRRAAFLHSLAVAYRQSGDVEAAIRAGTQSLALFRAAGAEAEAASIENSLALAYLALGNLSRASQLVAEAREQFQRTGDTAWLAQVTDTQAQIALALGQSALALDLAVEAIALAEAADNRQALVTALLTEARAYASADDFAEADRRFERLLPMIREAGQPSLVRELLTEWSALYAAQGQHARAYQLAREALSGRPAPSGAGDGQLPVDSSAGQHLT